MDPSSSDADDSYDRASAADGVDDGDDREDAAPVIGDRTGESCLDVVAAAVVDVERQLLPWRPLEPDDSGLIDDGRQELPRLAEAAAVTVAAAVVALVAKVVHSVNDAHRSSCLVIDDADDG